MVGLLNAMPFFGASACWLSHMNLKPLPPPLWNVPVSLGYENAI